MVEIGNGLDAIDGGNIFANSVTNTSLMGSVGHTVLVAKGNGFFGENANITYLSLTGFSSSVKYYGNVNVNTGGV